MKKPSLRKAWMPAVASMLILVACKKTDVTLPSANSSDPGTVTKSFGAVDDDPVLVTKVPVIMSANFMETLNQRAVMTSKGGNGNGNSGGGTTSGGDVTPPTVSITSPANGATVSAAVNVSVSASDNIGVASLSLSVDGSVIGTVAASAYTFSWDATNASSGTHTLTARATDAAGNYSNYSITVTKNTTVMPSPSSTPSSLSLIMPPVGNQGGEFSCVAFAAGYAVRSAEQFYKSNATSYAYSTNLFSPEFLYDQTKLTDCSSGTSILRVLDFMKNTGVCTWQSMPYSDLNGCSLTPTASQTNEAVNFKITSYTRLYNTDVTAIKTMLVNKHPLVFMVATDQSLWNAGPGFIWKSYSGSPGVGHAMAICGYDDAKHAWKVFNSWGTNWGDAGYTWIDYDFLPQAAYYSYAMTL